MRKCIDLDSLLYLPMPCMALPAPKTEYAEAYLSRNLLLNKRYHPLGSTNYRDRQIQSEMTCVQDICHEIGSVK